MNPNELLKKVSDFIAHYRGLPVIIGVGLIFIGMIVNLLPAWPVIDWFAKTDLLLHIGCIVGLMGILLGDAVG